MAVGSHQQIDLAVVIEIGGNGGETEAIASDAGLVRDVRELTVAVVAVEVVVRHYRRRVAQRIGMHLALQRPAAHHEEIRLPVVVVVEPDASGTGTFQ